MHDEVKQTAADYKTDSPRQEAVVTYEKVDKIYENKANEDLLRKYIHKKFNRPVLACKGKNEKLKHESNPCKRQCVIFLGTSCNKVLNIY